MRALLHPPLYADQPSIAETSTALVSADVSSISFETSTVMYTQNLDDKQVLGHVHAYTCATNVSDKALRVALSACSKNITENNSSACIVIVLDWSHPELFIRTVRQWIERVGALMKTSPDFGMMNDKALERFKLACVAKGNPAVPEHCLEENIGMDVCVVACRSELIEQWERNSSGVADFIQQSLRTVGLYYGASVHYVSSGLKQQVSVAPLRHALVQSLQNKSPEMKPNVVEKDMLYVPAGWDTWGKIRIINETFDCESVMSKENIFAAKLDGIYLERPVKPTLFIQALAESDFLEDHVEVLQQSAPLAADAGLSQKLQQLSMSSQSLSTADTSPRQNSSPVPAASNTVIANFFQSLLKKDNNSSTSRSAVEAELDKMRRK